MRKIRVSVFGVARAENMEHMHKLVSSKIDSAYPGGLRYKPHRIEEYVGDAENNICRPAKVVMDGVAQSVHVPCRSSEATASQKFDKKL